MISIEEFLCLRVYENNNIIGIAINRPEFSPIPKADIQKYNSTFSSMKGSRYKIESKTDSIRHNIDRNIANDNEFLLRKI